MATGVSYSIVLACFVLGQSRIHKPYLHGYLPNIPCLHAVSHVQTQNGHGGSGEPRVNTSGTHGVCMAKEFPWYGGTTPSPCSSVSLSGVDSTL